MNKNIWAKTILTSYRYLERLADSIDRMIDHYGLFSSNLRYQYYSDDGMYGIADKIITLGDRKIKLINLKCLVETALEGMEEKYSRLLISKYIDGKTNDQIIEMLNLSIRTFYRHLYRAEQIFEQKLYLNGYSSETLENYLMKENWIIEIRNRLLGAKEDQDINISEYKLTKLAVV